MSLSALGLDALIGLGRDAINKIWPDPVKRAEELRKLEELHQAGDLERLKLETQLLLAQAKINLADAQSPSKFQSWWRPTVGWGCGAAVIYNGVIYPLLLWAWTLFIALGWISIEIKPPPMIGMEWIMPLLLALLGLRSYDKTNGTDTKE